MGSSTSVHMPFIVGASFHSAPLEVLAKLAVSKEDLQSVVKELAGWIQIRDLTILSTCNRTEIIGTSTDVATTKKQIATYFNTVSENITMAPEYLYCHTELDAVTHLFRVVSGLDSMMLGETEIIGQLQYAFGISQCESLASSYFVQLFDAAFRTSNRVRRETGIDQGTTSVAKAAVHMSRRIMGDLSKRRVLIVGAGDTGKLACTYLNEEKAALYVTNRTEDRAIRLAAEHGGTVMPFCDLEGAIAHMDIVFLATAAKSPLVTREMIARVQKKRRGELLLLVDISLPCNAAPDIAEVGNVFLFNMDDLKDMVAKSLAQRANVKTLAEKIIAEEVSGFFARQRTLEVGPIIASLRASFEAVSADELARFENQLSKEDRAVLRQFAGSLVNKLLHLPTMGVRELANEDAPQEKVEWLKKLFGLNKPLNERMRKK